LYKSLFADVSVINIHEMFDSCLTKSNKAATFDKRVDNVEFDFVASVYWA